MIENGGWLVSANGKRATVNSPANVQAFNYVKTMLGNGSMKLTNQLGVGWGGEGFGKKMCAMTIEGNWIAGAMKNDYPSVGYRVVQLPQARGPGHAAVRRRLGPRRRVEEQGRRDEPDLLLTATKYRDRQREGVRRHAVGHVGEEEVAEAVPAVGVVPRRRGLLEEHPAGPRIATVLGDFNQQLQALPTHEPEDDPRPGQCGAAGDPRSRPSTSGFVARRRGRGSTPDTNDEEAEVNES